MTKSEILAFLNTNQLCYLATIDGNQPRVRGLMLYRADDNGIVFHSGHGKDMVKQMKVNPAVELCVFSTQDNTQVRVSGVAEFFDDLELKKEIVAARPFLQPIVDAIGYEPFALFRIKDCTATVWTMQTDMEPKTYVKL